MSAPTPYHTQVPASTLEALTQAVPNLAAWRGVLLAWKQQQASLEQVRATASVLLELFEQAQSELDALDTTSLTATWSLSHRDVLLGIVDGLRHGYTLGVNSLRTCIEDLRQETVERCWPDTVASFEIVHALSEQIRALEEHVGPLGGLAGLERVAQAGDAAAT